MQTESNLKRARAGERATAFDRHHFVIALNFMLSAFFLWHLRVLLSLPLSLSIFVVTLSLCIIPRWLSQLFPLYSTSHHSLLSTLHSLSTPHSTSLHYTSLYLTSQCVLRSCLCFFPLIRSFARNWVSHWTRCDDYTTDASALALALSLTLTLLLTLLLTLTSMLALALRLRLCRCQRRCCLSVGLSARVLWVRRW